ncbi:MAG: membrane dipeptidase [Anaerolineales bacterium]|nr:membrane dipeptidase [Anaerolineales bacterium]
MFIVDAHLDIAYNALKYGRDVRKPLAMIRAGEKRDKERGTATVALPAMRQAGVGLVWGTIFVSPTETALKFGGNKRMTYSNAAEAHKLGMDQLDYYRRLTDDETNDLRLVGSLSDLDAVLASQAGERPLIGILPLMEGADPIREPETLEMWVEMGLRAVGLAWDDTRYASGAWRSSKHGLTTAGMELLDVMADLGVILDLTHMSEKATLEALDHFEGSVAATHSNARALVPGERQLSDTQIQRLGERNGMIGIVLYNRFLRAGHGKGDPKELVTLEHVVAHIDHICQLLGDAKHVGIGSDFDGGLGVEDIPAEMNSIADLPLIAGKLREYGYAENDIVSIMGDNWLNFLRRAWTD